MKNITILAWLLCGVLAACSADMKPPRPLKLPFDLSVTGFTQVIEFEVLKEHVGVGLVLMLYHSDSKQREYLRAKVCDDTLIPTEPVSPTNPRTGVVIPIQVRLISEHTVIFDEVRQTKACTSGSASDAGWFDRNVYGRPLPEGKYKFEIKNVHEQPAFQGYQVEIRIPGDRKV